MCVCVCVCVSQSERRKMILALGSDRSDLRCRNPSIPPLSPWSWLAHLIFSENRKEHGKKREGAGRLQETKISGQAKGRKQSEEILETQLLLFIIHEERQSYSVDALSFSFCSFHSFFAFLSRSQHVNLKYTSPCNVAPPSVVPLIIEHMQRSIV